MAGGGTRVELLLPARTRGTAPAAPVRRRTAPVRAVVHGAAGDRLAAIAGALRGRGLQCVVTTSGTAAAAVLRTEPIDLLVVDQAAADATVLRAAASTTTPVLGTIDLVTPAGAGSLDEQWLSALVDAADELVGREEERARV